jgi:hypothetical protein
VALGYYLLQAYKKQKISVFTFAWISGLIAAYFVQNLAVFDSLVTYISLFVTLGLVYYLTKLEDEHINMPPHVIRHYSAEKEFALLAVLLIFFGAIIYQFNLRGFKMLAGVIAGYSQVAQGQIMNGMATYKATLADAAPYNRDSRSSFINLIAGNYRNLSSLAAADRQEVLDYAIELAQENVNYNDRDSLMEMQLAQIANVATRFNYQDLQKFNDYSATALLAINYALASSPGRLPLYFIKSDIQLTRGENDETIDTIKTALKLKEDFSDTHCQAANIYFFLQKADAAHYSEKLNESYDEAGQCAKLGGVNLLQSTDLIIGAIKYERDRQNNDNADILQKYLDSLQATQSQSRQRSSQ